MAEWSIAGPVILGIVIGLIELFLVHQDEAGMGWLGHGLHTIPFIILFLFISMNIHWAIGLIGIDATLWMEVAGGLVIAVIAAFKVKAAAAVVGKAGEKTIHAIFIGILIAVAPYLWRYAIEPIIGGMLPIK